MTEKERLEEIKSKHEDDKHVAYYAGITLTLDEYNFLIEQAEEVETLKQTRSDYKGKWSKAKRKIENQNRIIRTIETHKDRLGNDARASNAALESIREERDQYKKEIAHRDRKIAKLKKELEQFEALEQFIEDTQH